MEKDKTQAVINNSDKLKTNRPRWPFWLFIGVLSVSLIGAATWYVMNNEALYSRFMPVDRESHINSSEQDKNNYQFSDSDDGSTMSDMVERVSPSVVSILTTIEAETFWGSSVNRSSAGSGAILSKDGYVITNKHVVSDAKDIMVVLASGQSYDDVSVVFTDPMNDLAYLKIAGVDDLSPIEIGDSKTIKVGQPVLAIGNALGEYQNTVTNGIISGIGRSITAQDGAGSRAENLTDLIQTNAAINSGNSGGPLINAVGQLIGINTALAQNANGIGFAIPIGAAKGVIKQLGGSEIVKRGWVGINYVDLTPAFARQYDLPVTKGALIQQSGIVAGSPADKAGVKAGDIVLKVGEHSVGVVGGLSTLASEYAPGEEIVLVVLRNGQEIEIKLSIGIYS